MSPVDVGGDVRREAAERLLRAHVTYGQPVQDLSLAAWRRQDASHEAAYRQVVRTWDDAQRLRESPGYADLLGEPTWRERWIARLRGARGAAAFTSPWRYRWAGAMALLAIAATGVYWLQLRGHDYQTQVAEIREIHLQDGSVVDLGAKSTLDGEFSPGTRLVRLSGGEAFFSVAKDAARPFVVDAGGTLIRAVGTRFNVKFDNGRVRVAVQEGVVEVSHPDGGAADGRLSAGAPVTERRLRLVAGEQVTVRDGAPLPPSAQPLQGLEPGAWRQGRLSYRDAPLAEIVADANRYQDRKISILSPELGNQRITASFNTTQIEQMLETLPDTLPVRVVRNRDGSVVLLSRTAQTPAAAGPG